MQDAGGLRPEYKTYERQKCFVGHSHEAEWRDDILSACAQVLPGFGLEPWYAADHFDPTKPLRDKVVELVANARYGIYDLSSWRNGSGQWHLPRNVLIELGMAIVLNRPTLLLCHTSNKALPLPTCLQGVDLVEFAGETTLKMALEERLPQWFGAPPDRDWLNRFCIFGNRVCGFREEHPRARQWGHEALRCHISDGLDKDHPGFQKVEREEIRRAFENIFSRYSDLELAYLDELSPVDGYQFIPCSQCQTVRSTPFAVYRILPHSSADVFIAIGMSIALEAVFEYDIPKVLLVRQEQDLPSLLRGYEVVQAIASSEVRRKLKAFIPAVMQKVRETAWKPRPLPFIECVLPLVREVKADARKIPGLLRAGDLTLNVESRHLTKGELIYRLTPKEFELLRVFMRGPGRVLSRRFLMKKVWETDYVGDTRTLDVHIRRLREKIEDDPSSPLCLRTVRGVGYRFDLPKEDRTKIRIIIAHDTAIVREGLRRILREEADIEVVGEAFTPEETMQMVLDLRPEILVLGVKWFGDEQAGIEVIKLLTHEVPRTKLIAMSIYTPHLEMARGAGALAALTTEIPRQQLIEEIRSVYALPHPSSASAQVMTPLVLIATFGLTIEEVLASGELPSNVPTDYPQLCDWLEEDLRRRLQDRIGDFQYTEASKRDGEILSVRIAFQWQSRDRQPDFGDIEWWSVLELAPFEDVYPGQDASDFWDS